MLKDNSKSTYKKNEFISLLNGIEKREYGVSVKYFKHTESKPYKRIDYEVQINLYGHEKGRLIRFDKKSIFFNQHEPDTISERFAKTLAMSLYPVETIINGWGKQVAGIVNHEEIIKRWQTNKQTILENYEGMVVDDFIKAVDKKMANTSLIQRSMQHDLFWNLFFHPKYMAYTEKLSQPVDLYLSVIPYKFPMRFAGTQKIIPELTDYGSIVIKFESEELEAPKELLPGNKQTDRCLMKLVATFDLDKEHHFAMHTKAVLEVYQKEGQYTKIPVKKIQFTMYQL